MLLARGDLQINPKPIGTHLKLFVSPKMRTVRLQEYFRDVAVPQLVPSSIRFRIGKNGNRPVSSLKSQKQNLPRPQQSHFRPAFRIRVLPLPVSIELQRESAHPQSWHRETFRIARPSQSTRHSFSLFQEFIHLAHASKFLFRFSDSNSTLSAPFSSFAPALALCRASIELDSFSRPFCYLGNDPKECVK